MKYYEIKNLVFAILKYDFGEFSKSDLLAEINRAKIYYKINRVMPLKNDMSFFEIAMQTISNGVAETLSLLTSKLKKNEN